MKKNRVLALVLAFALLISGMSVVPVQAENEGGG